MGVWAQREGQPEALPKSSKDHNVCRYTNRSLATTTQRGSTPRDKVGFDQSAAVTGWFVAHVWMSVIFPPLQSSTVEGGGVGGVYATDVLNTQCLFPFWVKKFDLGPTVLIGSREES